MSDPVFTRCTDCNAKLRIKNPDAIGKKIRCPRCEKIFVVRPLKTPSPATSVSTTEDDHGGLQASPSTPQSKRSKLADASGTLVSWEEGIGDDKKYHIAHVSSAGITLVLKMKDYAKWLEAVTAANASPDESAAMLQQLPKAVHHSPEAISKATYAQPLNQLVLFDQDGKKTKIPEGKEQADVFAAISQYFGGTESEEEADAWSVMQSPLFILAVIGVIGGFFIWFTTICEPDYEASGRRSGMKTMLNWLGYKIGPIWMSVAVGSLAAIVLGMMIYQLIKRPIRQVLDFSS
jgi:hypothetical protein